MCPRLCYNPLPFFSTLQRFVPEFLVASGEQWLKFHHGETIISGQLRKRRRKSLGFLRWKRRLSSRRNLFTFFAFLLQTVVQNNGRGDVQIKLGYKSRSQMGKWEGREGGMIKSWTSLGNGRWAHYIYPFAKHSFLWVFTDSGINSGPSLHVHVNWTLLLENP